MIKKLFFLVVLVLGLTSTVSARNFVIDPCDPDLVGYWNLDEGAGTIAHDSDLQAANNGTLIGGAVWNNGEPGTVYFNGSSYVEISPLKHNGVTWTTNLGTIAIWVRFDGAQITRAAPIFTDGSTTYTGLHIFDPLDTLGWGWHYQWNGNLWDWNSGIVPPYDDWCYVALTVSGWPTGITGHGIGTIYQYDGTTFEKAINLQSVNWHGTITFNGNFYLGCQNPIRRWIKGWIDEAVVINRTLTEHNIYQMLDHSNRFKAYDPSPANNGMNISLNADLSWKPGDAARDVNAHHVYFGLFFADVNHGTGGTDKGIQDANTFDPGTLNLTQDYFWRIDEIDPCNVVTKGDVWKFQTQQGSAVYTSPANGSTTVPVDANLVWQAGLAGTYRHLVYFGPTLQDVNYLVLAPDVNLDPAILKYKPTLPPLALNTTYYWRIVERNEAAGHVKWPGPIWSFTTLSYVTWEPFGEYTDDGALWAAWEDGYYLFNGARIFLGPFDFYQVGTNGNTKSMWFQYSNNGVPAADYYSEAKRTFNPYRNWSSAGYYGVKVLALYFKGFAGTGPPDNLPANNPNAYDIPYVILEDSLGHKAMVKYGLKPGELLSNLAQSAWYEWLLRLQDFVGVDLTKIKVVHIGLGDPTNLYGSGHPGTDGTIWWDEFRLFLPACLPAVYVRPGDLNGDCWVNYTDLAMMTGDWLKTDGTLLGLADRWKFDETAGHWAVDSVRAKDANVIGGPIWVTDANVNHPCKALDFNGGFDQALTPALNLTGVNTTITAWIKPQGAQEAYAGIVFENPLVASCGMNFFGATTHLGLHWNNAHYDWDSGLNCTDNHWAFVALVATKGVGITLYRSNQNGSVLSSATLADTALTAQAFQGGVYIASMGNYRYFVGTIDDVRFYDCALTLAQLQALAASGTEPVLTNAQLYRPLTSPANIVKNPGPPYNPANPDIVNFKDYALLAGDSWLQKIYYGD